MSWQALTWASKQVCRGAPQKFVLIMLANHADEQSTCFPSVELLGEETQLGLSTVRRCIKELVDDKRVRVLQRWGRRGSRRSNRYQLLVDGPDMPLPEVDDWQHEYVHTPRPKRAAGDPQGAAADGSEDIPLGASTMSDQGVHSARSEHHDGILPGASGTYLPEREVTKEGMNLQREPPPPPPPSDPLSAGPDEGGVGEDPFQNPEADLTAFVAWFHDQRPDWRRSMIANTLVELTHDRRSRRVLRSAALVLRELVADQPHGRTDFPRRAVHDGLWWAVLRPKPVAPEQPTRAERCETHPWEPKRSCQSCLGEVKGAADGGGDGVGLPVDPLRQLALGQQLQRVLARNVRE